MTLLERVASSAETEAPLIEKVELIIAVLNEKTTINSASIVMGIGSTTTFYARAFGILRDGLKEGVVKIEVK